jgi:hypothetical protein
LPFLVSRFDIRTPFARISAVLLLSFGFLLGASSIINNWHYRLSFASYEGRIDDRWIVWNLTRNQAIDSLVAAARNLQRTFSERPYDIVPGASETGIAASNTINIWMFTAHRSGVPASVLVVIAAALMALSGACFRLLLRVESASSGRRLASSAFASS